MQGGPSPVVPHYHSPHQEEPVHNGSVTSPGCKVQGSGSLLILCSEVDVCESYLQKDNRGRLRAGAGMGTFLGTDLLYPPLLQSLVSPYQSSDSLP